MEDDLTQADFSGYATRADIRCSDGRTITDSAFAHQHMVQVPLVWQHVHDDPKNVLGHAWLEHRDASHPDGAGTYCYAFFNDTENGVTTKALVHNKDVKALSIYANELVEKVKGKLKEVLHGSIKEVSVVLSGANPGAFIENIRLSHSDGAIEELADEAVIFTGLEISIPESAEVVAHAAAETASTGSTTETGGETELDIYNNFSEKEKAVVHDMIGAAIVQTEEKLKTGGAAEHSAESGATLTADGTAEGTNTADSGNNDEGNLTHQEGSNMPETRNQFDTDGTIGGPDTSKRLTHDQLTAIVEAGKKSGSFKEAVLAHAGTYGINDINLLFPDAKALTETPEFISRRMEWVSTVLGGTKHSPFAKVKTILADITGPEARAKGYVTGARKEEEVFGLLRRTTGPGTIYKKQKLDRDDMLDITDINVVNWLKAEMRLMIEEELARAILVGDGRSSLHPDKVKDPAGALDGDGIRSIYKDDDLYSIKKELAANVSPKDAVKGIIRASVAYKGSGEPTLFISRMELVEILLEEDKFGRPLYADKQALANKLGVRNIVTVDIFDEYDNLYAIMVSLQDYTIGSNKGGELTSFEDFDIDFNQYKYLQETRLSGGLTKPFSAVVITKAQGTLANATTPSFNGETNTITIPTATGVEYLINDEVVTGNVVITQLTEVNAEPTAGYYLTTGSTRDWTYAP
jgi:hypothetical protein